MSDILRQVVDEGDRGQHDIVYLERIIGGPMADWEETQCRLARAQEVEAINDFDLWRAGRVMAVLKTQFPGHLWCVEHDLAQGICKISIPILMGICNWYVLNLRTHGDLTKGMVIAAGGEILERYRLPRCRLEIGSFLDARERHSALVNRRRMVPA
jgi:hypothetical protein